jgi:hypothetical protein
MIGADDQVLAFAALHEVVVSDQIKVLLRVDAGAARARVSNLAARGLLRCERLSGAAPGLFRITRAGPAALGSELPPPPAVTRWRHALAGSWLWVAAVSGRFGAFERIFSAREMRTLDRTAPDARTPSFGASVRVDDQVEPQLHYPDLLLVADWGRVAFQLQLDPISSRAVMPILDANARQKAVRVVVFLSAHPAIRDMVAKTAGELGYAGGVADVDGSVTSTCGGARGRGLARHARRCPHAPATRCRGLVGAGLRPLSRGAALPARAAFSPE